MEQARNLERLKELDRQLQAGTLCVELSADLLGKMVPRHAAAVGAALLRQSVPTEL